jgi:DNA-binding ferritin-like protein (Dps family)
VVNKVDILDEADVSRVKAFVAENAVQLLGIQPEVFLVSAKLALQAKAANPTSQVTEGPGQPATDLDQTPEALETGMSSPVKHNGPTTRQALWTASRFEPLERYILNTLDEKERLRLKLLNPLGVARRLHERYSVVAEDRLAVLADDFATIDAVEADLQAYQEDMRRDFRYHLSHIDNSLYAMSDRGMVFFDEMMRLTRIFDLINSAKVREAFEREVVGDTVQQVERQVSELIDWMVERDYKQWQAVMGYLNRRAELHQDRVIGQVGGSFELNRKELLGSVGRAAQQVVTSYDQEAESRQLAESVQMALAQAAVIEVGALGLGAIMVAALHTVIADVTGILFASTLAAVGLYVLPARRRKAQEELRGKVAELRDQLHSSLSEQFERELSHSTQRIREAIEPYTRFVRLEREKLLHIQQSLEEDGQELAYLAAQIDGL